MDRISIKKPTAKELEDLEVKAWGTWGSEVDRFDWEYDQTEVCYFTEGEVVIETPTGDVTVKAGDLVTFPQGLKCVWDVKSPIRKHYRFE